MKIRSAVLWGALLGLLVVGVARLPAEESRAFKEAVREGGELKYLEGLPVLFLKGTPEEMGRQQAALVGDVARPLVNLPRSILKQFGADAAWPLLVQAAKIVMSHAPERYRREMEAGAEAGHATQEERDALLVGCVVGEFRRFQRCAALLIEPERSATGGVLFGRNYDFPALGVLDRLRLVTIYRPKGYRPFVSIGNPGMLGAASGMNDAGLAVSCLDSGPAKDGSLRFDPRGAPMLITFRRVLEECATVEEAEKLLKKTQATTWYNLAVCDKRRAVVFEITPRQVVVRAAERHALACTNHFRTDSLALNKECWRYSRLEKNFARNELFAWSDVAKAMHEVNQGKLTLQTMVFEPGPLVLHVSFAPPPASTGPFATLKLGELFQWKVGGVGK